MKIKLLSTLIIFGLAVAGFGQGGPGGRGGPEGQGGPGKRDGKGQGFNRPRIKFNLPILQKAFENQTKLKFTGERKSIMRLGGENRMNSELIWRDGLNQRVEIQRGSSDAGQIIVLRKGSKWHYFPNSNEIQVKPAKFEDPLRRLGMLLSGRPGAPRGSVDLKGTQIIANLTTQLVSIRDPRGNEMMKLWIHDDSGLVVKREMFDPTGRLIGLSEYTKVNFSGATQQSDFQIKRVGAKVVSIQQLIKRSAQKAKVPPLVLNPGGMFELDSVRVVNLKGGEAMFQSYVSDIGRLSLIVSSTKIDASKLKSLAGRSNNTYVYEMFGAWIVLISDAPNIDFERIVRDVKQLGPPREKLGLTSYF